MIFTDSLRQLIGKETLHDITGVTQQTITEEESIDQEPDDDENLPSEEKTCFA